ncbi:hypothetical protein [Thiothrix fructosivorans]
MMARTLQAIREVLPIPFTADVEAVATTTTSAANTMTARMCG